MIETNQEPQQDDIQEYFAGVCAIGFLDCSIMELAAAIRYFIDKEARSINCDTHLIAVLRRSACAAWELANAQGAGLTAKLAEAREMGRNRIRRAIKRLPSQLMPGEVNYNQGELIIHVDDVLAVIKGGRQ